MASLMKSPPGVSTTNFRNISRKERKGRNGKTVSELGALSVLCASNTRDCRNKRSLRKRRIGSSNSSIQVVGPGGRRDVPLNTSPGKAGQRLNAYQPDALPMRARTLLIGRSTSRSKAYDNARVPMTMLR